jgi:hypothetical protein
MATLLVPGRAYAGDPEPPPGATKQPPAQVAATAKPNGPGVDGGFADETRAGPGRQAGAGGRAAHDRPEDVAAHQRRPANASPAVPGAGKGYQDGASKEDLSARTAYSAEFVNPDGSRTRRVYQDRPTCPTPRA